MRGLLLIAGVGGGLVLFLMMNSFGVSPLGNTRKGPDTQPPAWAENARLVGLHSPDGKRPSSPRSPLKTADVSRSEQIPLTTYEALVPFPDALGEKDFRSARLRSDLLNKYGPGDVNVAWLDHGTMNETFIYSGQTDSTHVLVEDGKVIAAFGN